MKPLRVDVTYVTYRNKLSEKFLPHEYSRVPSQGNT